MNTDTFTSKELCARYGCAQVTIRRKEAEENFPKGTKFGRKLIYPRKGVFEWERKHMPELHTEPELTEEDKVWDRLRRQRELDRETPPESKPEPKPEARKAKPEAKQKPHRKENWNRSWETVNTKAKRGRH